jgi:hypothetical protein
MPAGYFTDVRFEAREMKRSMTMLAALALLTGTAIPARADITVGYNAGDYMAMKLGNDGYPTNYDMLSLSGLSGHVSVNGGSQITVPLAVFDFTSGDSSYQVVTQFFNTATPTPWQLTVDGVTKTLDMPYSVNSNYTVDTLIMQDSLPLTFAVPGTSQTLTLEGLGFTSYAFLDTTEGTLYGRFSLNTPEPSTLVICGIAGLIGLIAARRRRRNSV